MIALAPGSRMADLRGWAGMADPVPSSARAGAALAAALVVAALTVLTGHPDEMGPRFGWIFLVFALLAGPAVAAVLVLRPWHGLVAWAALMALLNISRLQGWIGPIQVTQTTAFVAALAIGTWFDRDRTSWPRIGTVVALGLGAVGVLSWLASPDPATAAPIVLHGVLEPIAAALLVVVLRPSARQLAALGGGLVLGVVLASAYSIIRLGRVATTLAELENMRVQLAHFTYYNVGIFGDVLATIIPILIAFLIWRGTIGLGRLRVAIALGGLAILLAGLYLTYSKGAWLGSWLAVAAVIGVRFSRPRQLLAVIAGALLILAIIVPYPLYILRALNIDAGASNPYVKLISGVQGQRFSSWDVDSPDGEVSISERWRATQAGLRMAIDHPLLGVGPGRFGVEYATAYADPGATRHLGSPHNLFPEVAAELGLPAALLLLFAFAAAGLSAWRAARGPDPFLRALGGAFGAALLAFLAVTATFGLDLYRDYRVMNSDVIVAGLIVGACVALGTALSGSPDHATPDAAG